MPPHHGNKKDPRVTGEMIHAYMQRYAEDHDLLRRIHFNTFVESAKQSSSGGWRLAFRDSNEVVETEKLLVATGVTSIMHMPDFDGGHDASVPTIHSRDLGMSWKALQDEAIQDVVVVGAAKSAYDAVYLLLSMGKKVTWIIRDGGAGPLAILPFKILNTFNSIAVASTRLMTHLSPSILNTQGPLYWFLQRSQLGRWCTGRFWDFLDFVSGVHAGYGAGDHVSMLKPEIDRQRQETSLYCKRGACLQVAVVFSGPILVWAWLPYPTSGPHCTVPTSISSETRYKHSGRRQSTSSPAPA